MVPVATWLVPTPKLNNTVLVSVVDHQAYVSIEGQAACVLALKLYNLETMPMLKRVLEMSPT